MRTIQKWVLYSTLFGIFASRFAFSTGGLTIFYSYFLIVFNLILLAAMGYLWCPSKLRWFFVYLFSSGVLGLLLGTNSLAGFLKSFFGMTVCALCSAALLRFFRFNAVALFRRYAAFAYYSACIGLIMLFLVPEEHGRLVGLSLEPSVFCIVSMPAVFYYADDWQRNRRNGLRLLTLFVAYMLTFSSLGYLGLMVGGVFFGRRYRLGRVLVPVVVVAAAVFTYQQSDMFQLRLNDTLEGLTAGDVSTINASSYGIVANVFVTQQQFAAHPVLGGGLGSHVVAHERFIDDVPGAAYLPDELRDLGARDASSLFLRITSELGLVGLVYAFWFLWWCYPRGAGPEEQAIAIGILCTMFLKLVRSGEYFSGDQFFFLSIYAVIGVTARLRAASTALTKARPLQLVAGPLQECPATA